MIPPRALAATLLGIALAGATAQPASARVDPSRVQSDVDASMREGAYLFCKRPREPLSRAALALCPRASSVPGCEGFSAACARSSAHRGSLDVPAWLEKAIGSAIAWAARVVAWVLLPGLVLALLVPALRALARKRTEQAPASPVAVATSVAAPEAAPPVDEDALLARADEQAGRQAYGVALELYLAASLASLDRRGALDLGRDRTNGEYVRACREAPARSPLRELAAAVDRVKFGGQAATPEGAERAGAAARSIVRGLGASIAALAALACLGCGGVAWPGVPRPGDDPAGHELLVDVLRRQGFQAGELAGALSSLPLPAPGETTPAVVLDLEKTEIDDETGDHLVRWVEAGGSLVLGGRPERWPKELRIAPTWTGEAGHVEVRRLLAHGVDVQATRSDDEGEEDDEDAPPLAAAPIYASTTEHADVVSGAGLLSEVGERVAWLGDGTSYAVRVSHGLGSVIGVATGELLTNVALARPGSAKAALALLSNADREQIEIARPEDGVSPPSTPLAAMQRAGLGLGLAHALAAALLLFIARGVRLARPANEPPPARRAFVEHVEAVGALYRRGGHAAHALAAYARFAEQRLRARMPHGASDIPSLLASRGGVPLEAAARLWARATTVSASAPVGDELGILKELAAAYSRAVDQDR